MKQITAKDTETLLAIVYGDAFSTDDLNAAIHKLALLKDHGQMGFVMSLEEADILVTAAEGGMLNLAEDEQAYNKIHEILTVLESAQDDIEVK